MDTPSWPLSGDRTWQCNRPQYTIHQPLTAILPVQLLDVDISCTVGVRTYENGGAFQKREDHDTLPQSAGLATAKWTQH